MEREIVIDTEQLESLLALIDKHGTIGDFYTARDIFKAESTALLRKGDNKEWAQSLALGAVLRIGYIMGQRAERRRHTHTHTPRRA